MVNSREALDVIAKGHALGDISTDVLIKACENYKFQNGIYDDFEYSMKVSKSLIDHLNGVVSDELNKAIVPGQTKYLNGVVYVYSATKKGSKTEYGWHVLKNSNVGKGSKMDDATAKKYAQEVNLLFPTDVDKLSVVSANIGGSTGAVLVKDAGGNMYVMKKVNKAKNPNGHADHIRSEYTANVIYNILGLKTPDVELYNANSDKDITLLSRYIPGTRDPNSGDFGKMAEGFIADVLLANWDIYQNDNCLIDAGGNVVRVDNGGSLFYRAQGALKSPPFDGDVLRTYKDMRKYNSLLSRYLVDEDVIAQIDSVLSKKDDLVTFLKDSGDDKLAKILEERIDGLKGIKDYINAEIRRKETISKARAGKIAKRQLLSEADMYRDIKEDELKQIFDDVASTVGSKKYALTDYQSKTGWSILSKICELRGFNARPRVVQENDFWKEAGNSKHPIMFRGNSGSRGKSAAYFCDSFRFDDSCFYGTQGIWGQGIYAHTDDTNKAYSKTGKYDKKDDVDNKSTQKNFKASQSYSDAYSYAVYSDEGILKLAWEKDANVVNLDDLIKEIKSNPPKKTDKKANKEINKLQDELNEIKKNWADAEIKVQNIAKVVRDGVYKKMGYNEQSISEMYNDIDNTNWGNKTANNKPDYPSYDEFVVKNMAKWITDNGGKVELGENKEYVLFKIGGATLSITRHGWDTNSIKRKNSLTQPYNYHAERFKLFMETNYIGRVGKMVDNAIKNSHEISKKLRADVEEKKNEYYAKKTELDNKIQSVSSGDDLYSHIYSNIKNINERDSGHKMSVVGIYAAMKGYDGIYVHNGNGGSHGFNVILNRSKIVTSID